MQDEPEPRDGKQGPPRGLSPEQAVRLLDLETAKRRRIARARSSGSRLVTVALTLGVLAMLAAWLLPGLGVVAGIVGALAVALGALGVLRLLAAAWLARGAS